MTAPTTTARGEPTPPRSLAPPVKPGYAPLLAWSALATVYVVWGSTYLGLRIAVDTLPPFAMVGVRFVLAGALLYAFTARGGDRPTRRHWRNAAISGGLLVVANGLVAWAEQDIPSGVAALVVATVPLFMTLIDAVLERRGLHTRVVLGLAIGLAGVALLVRPGADGSALPLVPLGGIVLAALLWAIGSVHAGRAESPSRPLVGVALQMLAGGGVLTLMALLAGDFARFDPATVSAASAGALVYLVLVGSLLGFTAYAWTLRSLRLDVAATYAFVNPVVAVGLGWLVLDERLTTATVLAGAVVVAGVALIVSARSKPTTGERGA